MDNKVSIIITCFNQQQFIEKAIGSVISQTYDNWECIIVDDGSSDNSAAIIQQLISNEPRCHLILQENKGVSAARNKGFSLAKGSYIQFLDGDDFLAAQKLEIQADYMSDNPDVDICYSNHRYYLDDKNISVQYSFERLHKDPLNDILYKYDNGVSIPIHTALFRKKLWNAEEFPFATDYDGRYEDWVFWVKLALKKAVFRFLDYDMAFYRMHTTNFCNNEEEVLNNSVKAATYISHLLKEEKAEQFLAEKKIFFEERYQANKTGTRKNGRLFQLAQKLRNKGGQIKRSLQNKLTVSKEIRYRAKLKAEVKNKDFSIISNNCWGGGVYEDLGLEYTTPTIGLYFYPECFIKFVTDLDINLSAPLEFVAVSKYEKANELRKENPYPVGLLNGEIEIHFLHYLTRREASEKWNRRKQRVNRENLFLSFTDSEGFSDRQLNIYDQLPYSKVFFTAAANTGSSSAVQLKQYEGMAAVGDIYTDRWAYRKDFNVVKWLNRE